MPNLFGCILFLRKHKAKEERDQDLRQISIYVIPSLSLSLKYIYLYMHEDVKPLVDAFLGQALIGGDEEGADKNKNAMEVGSLVFSPQ